jgi:hypothetical protein
MITAEVKRANVRSYGGCVVWIRQIVGRDLEHGKDRSGN